VRGQGAKFLARLARLSLVIAFLVISRDNLLQVLEHLRAGVGATTFSLSTSRTSSTLVLALHLFHLALRLAHSELLSEGQTLLAQLLLLLLSLRLECRLDLALLSRTFLPLLLFGELGFLAKGERVQAEHFSRRFLLALGDVDGDRVFQHQGRHVL